MGVDKCIVSMDIGYVLHNFHDCHFFFSFRRKDVVKYLIQAGGDLNMQARDGCKALDLALVIVSGMSDSLGCIFISIMTVTIYKLSFCNIHV